MELKPVMKNIAVGVNELGRVVIQATTTDRRGQTVELAMTLSEETSQAIQDDSGPFYGNFNDNCVIIGQTLESMAVYESVVFALGANGDQVASSAQSELISTLETLKEALHADIKQLG